jgi:hypothetical protein
MGRQEIRNVTEADRDEFQAFLADVFAYYRQPLSDFTLDTWWAGCEEYQLADLRKAVTVHIRDPDRGSFLVKLSDISRQLGGGATDRGVMAWSIVLEVARIEGAYRDVDFGDAAVHQAITDLGGWPLLCRAEVAELRHLQHRFMQGYQVFSTRGAPSAPLYLAGDRDREAVYESHGLPPPRPVRVLSDLRRCDPKQLLPGRVLAIGGPP